MNLCDSCRYDIASCRGNPKLSGDDNSALRGAEADAVVVCDEYEELIRRSVPNGRAETLRDCGNAVDDTA